jgi:anti-sigma factor RsiW
MNCERIEEQLEAYALGALEFAEEQQVEQQIETCPKCMALLTDYQEVVATLPQLSAQQPPEALNLKESLMQRLEAEDSMPPQTVRPPAPVSMRQQRRSPFWARRWPVLAGAALLIVLLVWIGRVTLSLSLDTTGEMGAIAQQQELVRRIVESSESAQYILEAQEGDVEAEGRLFVRPGESTLVLTAHGLPQPPPGESYFVWYGSDEESELAGTIGVSDEGFGLLVFESDDVDSMNFTQIALQPVSDLSTGKLVLRWAQE